MKRRILSIVTALALCLGLCPTWAFAVEGETDAANVPMLADEHAEQQENDEASVTIGGTTTYYTTLEEAFSAANRNTAAITMLADAECTSDNGSPLSITGGTVTLNMDGHTLSGQGSGWSSGIIGVSGGSLTVQGNGTVQVSVRGVSCSGGALTIVGTKFNLVGNSYPAFFAIATINGGSNAAPKVNISGGEIAGPAQDGQIYHMYGTTTINDVTATGTTKDNPIGVHYWDNGTLKINGGSFSNITVAEETSVSSVAELLGNGVTYKHQDGTWAAEDELAEMSIENVTVEKVPLTINPSAETYWYYNSGEHSLTMNAQPVAGKTVTYEWSDGTNSLGCATDAYPVPADLATGTYTYTCEATCDGYTLSRDFTFEIKKSGTEFKGNGVAKAYLMGTEQYTFSVDNPITVIATPTATGQAPTNAAMAASFDVPTGGQMALFVDDTQVSEPVDAKPNGSYSMMTTAQDVLAAAGRLGTIELIARFVESSNQAEAESRVEITITAAAKVTTSSVTYYYGTIDDAWNEAKGKTATVTLLDNVTVTGNPMLQVNGGNVTFDGGEHILTLSGAFHVNSGTLTIIGGTISAPEGLGFHGNVLLRGGTFESGGYIVFTTETPTSLLNLLDNSDGTYRAFYKNGQPVPLEDNQNSLPAGTYTVAECRHNESVCEYQPLNGTETHKKTCLACGYTEDAEACVYADPTADDAANHTAVCTLCGQGKTEAHTIGLTATVSGSTITVSQKCDSCGYGADVGTVTFTIPTNLTYNDGQTIEWTASEGLDLLDGQIAVKFMWNGITLTSGAYSSPISLIDGSDTPFQTGSHTMQVTVKDSQGRTANVVEIPFTISPAKLTDAIVELEPGPFVYTGAAQTPAVTITHNELPLKINLDYALSWSNNTNAGDGASVTITGRGSYTGSVEKTFTIKKATPTVTAPAAGAIQYGQTLADSTLTGGTALNGSANVAGKWSWASPDTRPTAGGGFAATFTPTDTANYNTPESVNVNVAVNPTEPKITITAPSHQKEGQDVEITCTVENPHDTTKDDLPAVTLTYKIGNGAEQTMTGTSFTIPAGTAVDTVITITAATAEVAGKYSAATKTATVTVTDKTPVTISGANVENVTYDGESHKGYTGTLTAGAYNGKFKCTYAGRNGTAYNSETPPTNAGDYTVTIELETTTDYIGTLSMDFTISKATVTITAVNKSAVAGSTQPDLTYTVSGLASGDTLATEPTLSCTPDMNTVGSYPITASGAAVPNTSNYNSEITYVDGTLSVTAKPTTPSTPSNPGGGGNYTPSTPSTSLPVTTTGQNSSIVTTTTTATPTASTSGGKATTTVNTAMGNEIVKQAVANKSEDIVIAPKVTGNVSRTEVSIPAATVGQIGSQTNASLTIATPVADVTIPNGGLGSLSSAGGTITVTAEQTGNTVELSVTAGGRAVNYVPGGLTLTVPAYTAPGTVAVLVNADGTREVVRKSVADNGSVTIPLDGSAKVEIVDNSRYFYDVPSTSWAADAVAFASAHELFNGTGANQFSPNLPMSRGMLATVLHNLESNPYQPITSVFADVNNSEWYAEGVAWAAAHGIVDGYGNGQFGPTDNITREQLAVMLWRYAGSPAATNRELYFADAYRASSWALEALRWATENGVMNGKGNGILDPGGQATRAETAQMLKNFMENQ